MSKRIKKYNENNLTDTEQNFVDRFLLNGENGTQAYLYIKPFSNKKTAGIYATQILARENVKKYIALRKEKIREENNIQLEYLVKNAKKLIDEFDERKNSDDKIKPKYADFLDAIELLSKLGGYYNQSSNNVLIKTDGHLEISFGDWIPNEKIIPIDEAQKKLPPENTNDDMMKDEEPNTD